MLSMSLCAQYHWTSLGAKGEDVKFCQSKSFQQSFFAQFSRGLWPLNYERLGCFQVLQDPDEAVSLGSEAGPARTRTPKCRWSCLSSLQTGLPERRWDPRRRNSRCSYMYSYVSYVKCDLLVRYRRYRSCPP